MFFPDPSPAYFAPVKFSQLDADGNLIALEVDAQFKRLTNSEIESVQTRARNKKLNDDNLLKEVCMGWRVKQGEGDAAKAVFVPFSVDTLNQVEEKQPGFRGATVRAFYYSLEPTQAAHLAAVKN